MLSLSDRLAEAIVNLIFGCVWALLFVLFARLMDKKIPPVWSLILAGFLLSGAVSMDILWALGVLVPMLLPEKPE